MKITQTPNFSAKNLSFYHSIIYLLYIKQGRFRRSIEPPLGMFSKKQWDYFFSVEVKQSVLTSQPLTTRHSVRFTRPFTKPTVMPSSSNVLPSM